MKRIIIIALAAMACMIESVHAEEKITLSPENYLTFKIMENDSTFTELPKEFCEIKKHQNKVSKWSKIAGAVSTVGFFGGAAGVMGGGSAGTAMTGLQVMSTSAAVGSAADAANAFAGVEGMDIVFTPAHSAYTMTKNDNDIRIVVKLGDVKSIEQFTRVVRLEETKKDRRMRWFNYSYSLLGEKKAKKAGYVPFIYQILGNDEYVIIISKDDVTEGEYAVVFGTLAASKYLPASTFRIEK